MTSDDDKYAHFVEHPRYGRAPRFTGLNPNLHEMTLHPRLLTANELAAKWQAAFGAPYPYAASLVATDRARRIPNTAIEADSTRQVAAMVPVTHYFDLDCKCRDCDRPFIFFAREQKHWYEELGFPLEADCVRCVDCRKQEQGIARDRQRYETLYHVPSKTVDELLEMADVCLRLIEAGIFSTKQTERVRMLLNAVPDEVDVRTRPRFKRLVERRLKIESGAS